MASYITKWNDERILALNPHLGAGVLPDERIHVKDETPRKELRKKAELAARYCPNHVIRIEDL